MQDNPKLNGSESFDTLISMLSDKDPNTRGMVAIALGKIAQPETLGPLVGLLSDVDDRVKVTAAQSLGQLHDPRIVEPLLPLLESENPELVCAALQSLALAGSERSFSPIVVRLFDTNDDIRKNATAAIGCLRDPRAYEPLLIALEDSSECVRANAAWSLGQIGNTDALGALMSKVDSEDIERVRANAISSLIDLSKSFDNPEQLFNFVFGVAEDYEENHLVRIAAILSLTNMADLKNIEFSARLKTLLVFLAKNEQNDDLRSSAIWALGKFPRDNTISSILQKALHDPYKYCVKYAEDALLSEKSESPS